MSWVAILGGTAVTPLEVIPDSLVLVEGERLAYVGPRSGAEPPPGARIIPADGCAVLPGLIDTHVHGAEGWDVMLHGVEGIRRIARHFTRYGVTAWLPSTIAARHEELLR